MGLLNRNLLYFLGTYHVSHPFALWFGDRRSNRRHTLATELSGSTRNAGHDLTNYASETSAWTPQQIPEILQYFNTRQTVTSVLGGGENEKLLLLHSSCNIAQTTDFKLQSTHGDVENAQSSMAQLWWTARGQSRARSSDDKKMLNCILQKQDEDCAWFQASAAK